MVILLHAFDDGATCVILYYDLISQYLNILPLHGHDRCHLKLLPDL